MFPASRAADLAYITALVLGDLLDSTTMLGARGMHPRGDVVGQRHWCPLLRLNLRVAEKNFLAVGLPRQANDFQVEPEQGMVPCRFSFLTTGCVPGLG